MSNTRPLSEAAKDYDDDARRREIKDAMKEAVNEWLDEKYRQVGKWTLRGLGAMSVAALCYFILHFGKP